MSRHNGLPGYDAWKTRSPDDDMPYPPDGDDWSPTDSYPPPCCNKAGHSWVCRDDDEEISYCEWCGADGNA